MEILDVECGSLSRVSEKDILTPRLFVQKQTVIFEENPKWRIYKGKCFCQFGPLSRDRARILYLTRRQVGLTRAKLSWEKSLGTRLTSPVVKAESRQCRMHINNNIWHLHSLSIDDSQSYVVLVPKATNPRIVKETGYLEFISK